MLFPATRHERGIPAAWYYLSSPFTLIPLLSQLLFIIPHPKAMQNDLTTKKDLQNLVSCPSCVLPILAPIIATKAIDCDAHSFVSPSTTKC